MITIENFYYALHKHLLEPLGIQDIMYCVFGSTSIEHLAMGRYMPSHIRYGLAKWKVPSCYYCDQEPLNETVVYQVDTLASYWGVFKLLANSEHSELKDSILQNTKYHDWYYFFHGFAALDWYSDGHYFDQNIAWTKPYINLNRLCTNDRSYRLNLVARLIDGDVIDRGHVSLHLDTGNLHNELDDANSKLSASGKDLIKHYIKNPMYLDHGSGTSGDISADFGHKEFELWKSGLWHVVTETIFYYDKLHLTEKIFKPIVAQRPFILAAAPGNLAYLRSYGFKTFDRWIDESYDDIKDHDLRLQAIANQVKKICALSDDQLLDMHREMQEVLEYNFAHLYNEFKTIIVEELVNNFQKCALLWSNGRVDDRALPLEKVDFAQVKKILLR
jgi:hypothetical protein